MREREVRLYVCGLTPSGEAHLGHARSFLFFDVLRRYLEYREYDVTFVQNVTDVDDRSIAAARERGTSYRSIVDGHYASFKHSMRLLGVREPDEEPYATHYVPKIQEMIRALVQRGNAYAVEDGVYYAVRTFPAYGALSGRRLDDLEAGARIEIGEYKRDPLDFALWKFAKPGEPSWPFEGYAAGRPGWHIECSAMSRALLDPQGSGFDVHGGGADLIFPHHENEIAQSEPLMAHPPMAKLWLHGGLLLFDSKKMSKSLGNFEPLSALLERHDPQAIRLLFLQTGYRKVMNFTEDSIAAAGVVLERLKKAYRLLLNLYGNVNVSVQDETGLISRVDNALGDDMHTAVALRWVIQFADSLGISVNPMQPSALDDYTRALTILGIAPNESWHEERASFEHAASADDDIAAMVARRQRARAEKDWATADELRRELAQRGIELIDTAEGPKWRKTGGH